MISSLYELHLIQRGFNGDGSDSVLLVFFFFLAKLFECNHSNHVLSYLFFIWYLHRTNH